jgi:hypothetical protein
MGRHHPTKLAEWRRAYYHFWDVHQMKEKRKAVFERYFEPTSHRQQNQKSYNILFPNHETKKIPEILTEP